MSRTRDPNRSPDHTARSPGSRPRGRDLRRAAWPSASSAHSRGSRSASPTSPRPAGRARHRLSHRLDLEDDDRDRRHAARRGGSRRPRRPGQRAPARLPRRRPGEAGHHPPPAHHTGGSARCGAGRTPSADDRSGPKVGDRLSTSARSTHPCCAQSRPGEVGVREPRLRRPGAARRGRERRSVRRADATRVFEPLGMQGADFVPSERVRDRSPSATSPGAAAEAGEGPRMPSPRPGRCSRAWRTWPATRRAAPRRRAGAPAGDVAAHARAAGRRRRAARRDGPRVHARPCRHATRRRARRRWPGFVSALVVAPDDDAGVVVFTNTHSPRRTTSRRSAAPPSSARMGDQAPVVESPQLGRARGRLQAEPGAEHELPLVAGARRRGGGLGAPRAI